jgi:hypothetical protein
MAPRRTFKAPLLVVDCEPHNSLIRRSRFLQGLARQGVPILNLEV